jgi:transposase-like protein
VAVGITPDGRRRRLGVPVTPSEAEAPKLAPWAEENLPEGFTVFGLPQTQRAKRRTTNGLERLNREIKRRTRVASIFPNTASCLRLVSARLAECDEDWMTSKVYLDLHLISTARWLRLGKFTERWLHCPDEFDSRHDEHS